MLMLGDRRLPLAGTGERQALAVLRSRGGK